MTTKSCATTMKLLGDYWTLRIIDSLRTDNLRFCELQRRVDNLNPVTLTSRLKKLETSGLLNRIEDLEDEISVNYELSSKGRNALPVIDALNKFSTKI
ncbi:MAG: helix-turn-helix transcriptional regulator [bacterium]|nr:helix-turn-helix transcriptional regulator [bacterium]